MPIRVTVWGENVHEKKNKAVADNYPQGMHGQIAKLLGEDTNIKASTATLQEPEHGMTEAMLDETDVLVWWGHAAHDQVDDAIVERVAERVWAGMGLIVLHSGHFSKIFQRLMGSPCALHWREAGERERIWVVNPGHPIAKGLPQYFELENEEMYGEPFSVPEPLETVFISWFQGGEVFRSGLTYRRGAGNIFYFRPGHETYPTYHDKTVGQVLRNAVNWAYNADRRLVNVRKAPNRPVEQAIEKIVERGAKLTEHPRLIGAAASMRLLVLGTGRMAANHAKHFAAIEGVTLVGGVDTDPANLAAFCDEHGIGERFASLEQALAWGRFDAVTNVTPDSIHHATTLKAIAAGKHVFCEKPLATSYPLAMEMVEAAEAAGRINMVNLTYRNVAELHKARALIAAGTIGTVKHIEASYLQGWIAARNWADPSIEGPWLWRLSKGHGSNGTLGDIGIHILDFTTFATGTDIASMNCRLQTFKKVEGDRMGEYVLDANDSFIISAEFNNGAIGTIHSSRWASGHSNDQRLRVYGEKGGLELSHGHWGSLLRTCVGEDIATGTYREIKADPVPTNYQRFAEAVRTGVQTEPSFRHAAGLQKVLDLALVADRDRMEHSV